MVNTIKYFKIKVYRQTSKLYHQRQTFLKVKVVASKNCHQLK